MGHFSASAAAQNFSPSHMWMICNYRQHFFVIRSFFWQASLRDFLVSTIQLRHQTTPLHTPRHASSVIVYQAYEHSTCVRMAGPAGTSTASLYEFSTTFAMLGNRFSAPWNGHSFTQQCVRTAYIHEPRDMHNSFHDHDSAAPRCRYSGLEYEI